MREILRQEQWSTIANARDLFPEEVRTYIPEKKQKGRRHCDGDAILMAQELAFNLGVAVGISSGCNFLAALRAQDKIAPDAAVVTVFCDDNKKYLSTALMHDEPVREDYLTPHIELLGLGTVGRACEFCH